jgi:hypothetical protein
MSFILFNPYNSLYFSKLSFKNCNALSLSSKFVVSVSEFLGKTSIFTGSKNKVKLAFVALAKTET